MTFLELRPTHELAAIDAVSGESISYLELIERAAVISAPLGKTKQLVFLLSRNDIFSSTAYLATQLAGHSLALLDGSKTPAEHADVLARYRPQWVIGPTGTAGKLADGGHNVGTVTPVLGGEIVSLPDSPQGGLHPGLALMLATSGTTGSSKYVRLSAANLEANARSIASYLGITPDERPMASLPLYYSFGLSILNSNWLAGATVVLSTESVMQRSFWDSIAERGCTTFAGVPYTYQMLERIGYRNMDLASIRTMLQAGGALNRGLAALYGDHMRAKGGRLVVMYGQTEATARIAWVPPDRLDEKLGSAGVAIPGGRLRIEAATAQDGGRPTGEVVYEGPNVMLGYADRREDLEHGDELKGVLHTGDIGYMDDDRFLFLTGRSKRIAKVYGLRINLDEVELMLRECGPAAVIAGNDVVWGFCAFGTDESVAALREALSRQLHIHRSGLDLRRVDDIPVSASGKVDYQQVERWIPR